MKGNASSEWINLTPSLTKAFGLDVLANTREDLKTTIGLSRECSVIEFGRGVYAADCRVSVPAVVEERYSKYRQTPIFRATRWESALNFGGQIWIKREDLTPSGSHKYNTAIAQAFYAKQQGFTGMVTDTGAGQWGLAVAMACADLGLKCIVFMAGHSFKTKAQRRKLMELSGARVINCGEPSLLENAGSNTLAAAMSEAMQFVAENDDYCLCQGCMSMYAPMHQSIIGLELSEQLASKQLTPNLLIACAGGGTNLVGFASPWIEKSLLESDEKVRIVGVESTSAPALTKGVYGYDSPDSSGFGGRQLMYSIGAETELDDIGAAGLRYHCKSPLLSLLVNRGIIEGQAVEDHEAKAAGLEFFQCEGVLPAPESAHALAYLREFVRLDPQSDLIIAINLSGSGLLDLEYYAPTEYR